MRLGGGDIGKSPYRSYQDYEKKYGKEDGEGYVDPVAGKKAENAERARFVRRYPKADMNRFRFEAMTTSSGDIGVVTWFVDLDGISSYDIRYDGFKKDKEFTYYLTGTKKIITPTQFIPMTDTKVTKSEILGLVDGWPLKWRLGSGVKAKLNNNDTFDRFSWFPRIGWNTPAHSFKVYVDGKSFFVTSGEAGGNMLPKIEDSIKIDGVSIVFDYKKPYFAALCGAYIATYLCGITSGHLTPSNDTYPVITSIMNFHLYYCIRKYVYKPERLIPYMDMLDSIKKHIPVKGKWVKKSDYYDVVYDYGLDWEKSNWIKGRGDGSNPVRNVTNSSVMTVNGFLKGIRVHYEERVSVALVSKSDYLRFVSTQTDPYFGLTKTGLLLLGESIEAYVYSVLGAQAATRSPITGSYGKSSATQVKFSALVNDCVIQADPVVTLGNMRIAIRDTNVVLNTAVTPGTVLIPSSLIILSKPIPGYNNILKNATKDMKRGVNTELNYVGVKKANPPKKQHQDNTPVHHLDTIDGNKKVPGGPTKVKPQEGSTSAETQVVPITKHNAVSTHESSGVNAIAGAGIGAIVVFILMKIIL